MILRQKPSSYHHGTFAGAAAAMPVAPVSGWLRRAVANAQTVAGKGAGPNGFDPGALEDIALAAGAALGALDAVVRGQEKWAGAWRQRLALSAAAITARQAGRIEDEAALRDAVLLTRPGDNVGPAGRMLLAWRRLAGTPAEKLLNEASIGAVLEDLGHARDDDAVSDLVEALRQLAASDGMVAMLTGTFMAAERHGFGRAVGAWLADALVAQRLGWTHAVPLLGTDMASSIRSSRSRGDATLNAKIGIEEKNERAKILLAAQARAALRAIDLFGDLGRRAERLLAVAPKLRARGADTVVDRLLSDDAMVASDNVAGMSDRGLRRLFDRLVDLGTVRELSGRPTFRIYGL